MKHATKLSAAISGILFAFALGQAATAVADDIVVNATTDLFDWTDGNCELREAITATNNNITIDACVHDGSIGYDTIFFDQGIGWPNTITLTQGQIHILETVQISGPGASKLSVSGNFNGRIFDVAAPTGIAGLSLWRGWAQNPVAGAVSEGGAIYTSANELVIDGCFFFNNKAQGADGDSNGKAGGTAFGGAIASKDSTTNVFVKNSAFYANFAEGGEGGTEAGGVDGTDGGGAFGAAIMARGDLVLRNTTFTGNGAYGGDAGVGSGSTGDAGPATGAIDSRHHLELRHVTIHGNEAVPGQVGAFQLSLGGGAYVAGDGEIEYSIVAGNSATQETDLNHTLAGNFVTKGYNVLGVEGIFVPAVGDVFGSEASPADPMLDPLADNGGETWTMALQAGSPALDIDGAAACLEYRDQRNVDRPQGAGCDAGAFELEALEPPPFCPAPQGFWKTNPALWPVTTLDLGGKSYTQAQLQAILGNPSKKDASVILGRQLIAAKLNVAAGADPSPVATAIADADALLGGYAGKLPLNTKTNSNPGKQMLVLQKLLEQFNLQQLTPGCPLQ